MLDPVDEERRRQSMEMALAQPTAATQGVAVAAEEHREQVRVNEDPDEEIGRGEVLIPEQELLGRHRPAGDVHAERERERGRQQKERPVVPTTDDVG